MFKNALVTVSDKRGLVEFLKPLVDQGLRIVSTGGTAQYLRENHLPVVDVATQTGFPEVFSGRVKTLHPFIHMPVLAREWVKEDQKILKEYQLESFDLVICNLYPFEKNQDTNKDKELVEWIDVGGPSLLRASAKNFFTVTTLCSPDDYLSVQKGTSLEVRKKLAAKTFDHLSYYDSLVAKRLKGQSQDYSLKGERLKDLRYGENPHQKSTWYKKSHQKEGLHQAEVLQGKELSFNNLLDFSAAVSTLREFKEPCCVSIKHNNPCGVACGEDALSSVSRSLEADPQSVFGGVLAVNSPVDAQTAKKVTSLFLEGLVAPDFSKEALEILSSKKQLRVLKWHNMMNFEKETKSFKDIIGGFLVQDKDQVLSEWNNEWKKIGEKNLSLQVKEDLLFAWKVCSHLKSNAISVVKDKQTLGLGMGQVNRVDAVQVSLERSKRFHPQKQGLILASDAFFPFVDSIEMAAQSGVSWIIQPGGSIKDAEVIKKVQDLGLNMILTGQRHFKH